MAFLDLAVAKSLQSTRMVTDADDDVQTLTTGIITGLTTGFTTGLTTGSKTTGLTTD